MIITKTKRVFAVLWFGLLVLRYAGLRIALQKLGHQLYGHTVFYGTMKLIEDLPAKNKFECYTTLASSKDIVEFFNNINSESSEGKYQLLVRKWYHQRGFGDCCVTKVKGTDEICVARWLVTKKHLKEMGWEGRFSKLEDKDILRENVYVFERFRTSATNDVSKICLEMGFTCGKGWITEDNTPELLSGLKLNWLAFEKVQERHFLFHVTRKTIETYDPPIPIPVPQEYQ